MLGWVFPVGNYCQHGQRNCVEANNSLDMNVNLDITLKAKIFSSFALYKASVKKYEQSFATSTFSWVTKRIHWYQTSIPGLGHASSKSVITGDESHAARSKDLVNNPNKMKKVLMFEYALNPSEKLAWMEIQIKKYYPKRDMMEILESGLPENPPVQSGSSGWHHLRNNRVS